MKGYVLDPSQLRGTPEEQLRQGYETAARMLRDDLGVDGAEVLAEVRRRAERDPVLRAMFAQAAAECGLPVDELLSGARRMAAEERRLRDRDLSEDEVWRGLVLWAATDLGVDPDELQTEWERELCRRRR